MGTEEVKTKFSIQSTEQVIDMLGLMGDASDNIPGCPGVGEKTAQKLIAEFGSIENLLEHTDQLKGALKTKVETNREMISLPGLCLPSRKPPLPKTAPRFKAICLQILRARGRAFLKIQT